MKKTIINLAKLAFSGTAKITYLMFAGNVSSAALAFITVIFLARSLSPLQFGLFFALYNIIQLVSSVADFGVGSGLVNFIPKAFKVGKYKEANQFLKSGWDFVIAVGLALTVIGVMIPQSWIQKFLPGVSFLEWVATVIATSTFILVNFLVFAFQARKEFIRSIVANLGYSAGRTILIVFLSITGKLSVIWTMIAYAISSIAGTFLSLPFLPDVIGSKNKPSREQVKELLKFSSHLGIGKIASNIGSRIDILMLFPLAGAAATSQYGIAQRISLLYVLFSSSAGAVITPKIASIISVEQMRKYAKKIFLLSFLLVFGVFLGVVFSEPLVPFLFGSNYPGLVPVVQWTLIATIPFLLNLTPVNIVIYFQKDSKTIGILSVIQLALVILLNWLLIPSIGVYGPIISYALGNTLVGAVAWFRIRKILL